MARAVLLALVALALVMPAVAYAQGSDPMMRCKNNLTVQQDVPQSREPVGNPGPGEPKVFKNHLEGNVRVDCDDMQLFADQIDWRDDEQTVTITGHVLFVQPGVRIYAERAIVNRITKLGTFHVASGYTQMNTKPGEQTALFDGLEPDMYFWGDALVKIGDKTYRLIDGGFTSCVQPTPRWDMSGSSGTVTVEKHVMMWNTVLHVKDVPMFYLPVMYYPINKEQRATGFLMPKYGSSTAAGFTLTNAFFWAIDRSQDATVYYAWFKKGGGSLGSEYRYVSAPGSTGEAKFNVISQTELPTAGGGTTTVSKSYNVSGNANQELPDHFRLIANVDYFTDATTQQLYQQNVLDISQRTRTINATVAGAVQRLQISASFNQNDVFQDLTSASRLGYLPKLSLTLTQKRLGTSPVYFGAAGEVAYLVRQDNLTDPTTDHSLWRFDGGPQVRIPMSTLPFLTVTTTANYRITEWMESQDPVSGAQVKEPLTRQLFTVQTSLVGPVFLKVFNTNSDYAEKIKHLIEPTFTFQYTSPFNELSRVVYHDGTDTIVGGTTQITYGVTNRWLAKRKVGGGPGVVSEILHIDIGQTYYSNALAAPFDPSYQTNGVAPPTNFNPVQVNVVATPTSLISARFLTNIDAQFKRPRDYSASGSVNEKILQITAGWIKRVYIPGLIGYNDPTAASQFLNLAATIKRPDNRYGGTYSFNYDVQHSSWLQRRFTAYYNSQCCGVQVDYQSADIGYLGLNTTTNRHFAVAFTLAGLGSFSNPMGSPTR